MPEIVVSGLGVTAAIGQGKAAFTAALMEGRHRFGVMGRPGRQWVQADGVPTSFLGAEIDSLQLPTALPTQPLRTASFAARVAATTLHEAWHEAGLDAVDPLRIGLVIGGSNVQQRELVNTQAALAQRAHFLRPTYALSFLDSDLCGICTELFGIRAFAYTLGAASASGQAAVIQAVQAVQAGHVDVCIAMGSLMDLSFWECQGFRALGAMGSDRFATEPDAASRPFDAERDGFIFGEACAALVVERDDTLRQRAATPYARVAGWAVQVDGNRNPNPSLQGEMAVIRDCLSRAGLTPAQVDYVNPHASGSVLGDATELQAIVGCGLQGAGMNTTKSITGHGLTAAGALELAATLLQMRDGRLHPSRNLSHPIGAAHAFVGEHAQTHKVRNALKLSMGFGGVNTALCLQSL